MKLKILTELPTSALLLSSSRAIVSQIRVGVIIEEARHGWSVRVGIPLIQLNCNRIDKICVNSPGYIKATAVDCVRCYGLASYGS